MNEGEMIKVNRGGTTKYVVANVAVMLAVLAGLVFTMKELIPGPWWKWLVLAPVAFLIAGFCEERLLSKWVNQAVERCCRNESKIGC
jgi:hypothetical protein